MYRIGIDLGGTNIVAGLVDAQGHICRKASAKTNAPRAVEAVAADMAQLVCTLLREHGVRREDILSVGVGVPGTANRHNGHVEDANNLGWEDAAFLPVLSAQLDMPVFFENDANAAALGEYHFAEYHADSFLMLTIGTGIGGAILLDGKLYTGVNGAAAEFGHMTIDHDGVACNCGRRGCFEALASASALIEQAKAAMSAAPNSLLWELCGADTAHPEAKTVFDAAQAGDETALSVLDRYTDYLAEGISNLINIFQPTVLCIGGGVSRAGEALLQPVREKTQKRICTRNASRRTQIVLAKLDNDAGVLGAALLGEERSAL